MVLILFQLILLIAICLGWVYWLNRWVGDGSWRWQRSVVLFGVSFAIQILLLQNLVYLDFPVVRTFAIPSLVGLAGLWRLFMEYRTAPPQDPALRRNVRFAAALFLGVFCLQSVSGILQGPSNYYGKAHIDHLNYGFISEYLRTEPFSMPDAEMVKQPWLVKASQQKNNRIGQSIAQGYLASLSFVSSKESYAALCSFFVATLALSIFALAQAFSLSRSYATIVAVWVGLAPATTRIHLDGFLSQTAVLFVFPLLILWARQTQENIRFKLTCGSVLISYLLVSYTEYFVIGLFLFGLLSVGLAVIWSPRQIAISAAAAALGLALVPAYLPRAYHFAVDQYSFASRLNPAVEVLAPDGGTVYGWAKALIELPLPAPLERSATTALGFLLIALCAAGLFTRSRRHQLFLAAATLTPLVFLAILLSAQVLAKYPFQKICDSFTFLWVLLTMRGISLAAAAARRLWGAMAPSVVYVIPGTLLLLAFFGFVAEHRLVAAHDSSLALVNKPEYHASLQYVAAHPDRTYIIRHPHGLAAGWLAYEARKSRVFIVSSALADVPLSPGAQAFSKVPDTLDRVTFISINGYRDETTSGGVPDIEVDNPQGQDGPDGGHWYWLGDALNIDFFAWSGDKPQEYTLSFRGEPGPANPSPVRAIRLTNLRTGQQETLRFAGPTKLSIPVLLVRGKNTFRVESLEPLEQVTRIPNDPRKHMSRLLEFALSPPRPVGAADPRLSQMSSRDSIPAPLLVPHNPQREDRGADQSSWFWVGKQMELEIIRTDQSTEKFTYELTFDAQAGPANPDPKRKIRIRTADGRATDLSFTGTGQPTAVFTAPPGSSRLQIEVLSPTEQTVHIPNDPRNHMLRAANFRVKLIRGPATKPAAPEKVPALAGATR